MRNNLFNSKLFQYSLFLLFTVYSLFGIMQVVYKVNVYIVNVSLAVILAVMACVKIITGYAQTGPLKIAAPAGIIVFFYLSNLYAVLLVTLMYNLDLPLFLGFQIVAISTHGFFLTAPFNERCYLAFFIATLIYVSYILLMLENPIFSFPL